MQAERRGREENLGLVFLLFHLYEYSKYLLGSVKKAAHAPISCLSDSIIFLQEEKIALNANV